MLCVKVELTHAAYPAPMIRAGEEDNTMAPTPDKAPATRPLAEDIPTSLAWKQKRRVYVTCGYNSRLNTELRAIGAKWDSKVKALWVGTVKAAQVLPLVQAHQERIHAVAEIKARGLWVSIPYDAEHIRARAKELNGLWVKESKQWAMRTLQDQDEIRALVQTYKAKLAEAEERRRDEEHKIEEQAARERRAVEEVRRERAAQAARETAARVVAQSKRTPTGQSAELRLVSTRRMNKHTAREMAYQVGDLVLLDDGRRMIVTSVKVWFTGEEMASSICWHPQTHDEAHWDLLHTGEVVEPTAEEVAADAERAAQIADAAELHALMSELDRVGQAREDYTPLDQDQVVGSIEHTYGTWASTNRGGTAYLLADGTVVYRHPGYYDDYRSTERTTTDPELVARMRAALAQGERTRTHTGQMNDDYTVSVHGPIEPAPQAPAPAQDPEPATVAGGDEDLAARVERMLAQAGAEHYQVRDRAGRVSVHTGPGWQPTEEVATARQQVARWRSVFNDSLEVYADLPRFHGRAVRGADYLLVEPISAGRELWMVLRSIAPDHPHDPVRVVAVGADDARQDMVLGWDNDATPVRFEIGPRYAGEPQPEALAHAAQVVAALPGWRVRVEEAVVHAQRAEPVAEPEESRVRALVRVRERQNNPVLDIRVALVVHRPSRNLVECLRVAATTDYRYVAAYVDLRGDEEYAAHAVDGDPAPSAGEAIQAQVAALAQEGFVEVEPPAHVAAWLSGRWLWHTWDPRRS